MKKETSRTEVIEHWYSLVPQQNFSTADFYYVVEKQIGVQKIPGLWFSRVELHEGEILSDKREYLRMKRERVTFDVCAAPIGVNYFFSYRFYAPDPKFGVVDIVALIICLGFPWWIFNAIKSPYVAFTLTSLCALGLVGLILKDGVDKVSIIEMPVIGALYARFFYRDTYYRQDMRIAYCSIVSAIVKAEVERLTAAKGVKLLREHTYSPLLGALYKVKESEPRRRSQDESKCFEPVSS